MTLHMNKLRLGVLGCSGHYALRVAAPLKISKIVEPYALASRDIAKANEFIKTYHFSKTYGSYEALLDDPDVDFVYIPLPNNLHLEYIKKAADAGKPVICEKPVCLNAAEAKEAAEYCQKKSILLMEAFMYRFHPQWICAKEIVLNGEIGDLLSFNCHFSYMNRDADNIRNKPETGGGAIYDIGCYAVSTARFLFDREPIRAICTLIRDKRFKTDITTSGILDFDEGRTSTFTVSTQMCPHQRITAFGTKGNLSINIPFNMPPNIPGKITVSDSAGERVIESEIADQYLLQFEAFAESVIKKTGAPTPVSDAIANMSVLDALFKSAKTNSWVKIN
jgi:predicted dehydrogenase